MLDQGDESLRCIAAHHVGELGLSELRPRLEALMARGAGFFVVAGGLARPGAPGGQ